MVSTKVEFHTQAPDKLLYACRLLRKAAVSGAKVQVTAAEEALRQFDQLLWTFSNADFVPHCLQDAPPQVLANSPILLTPTPQADTGHAILLNLGSGVPAGFEQFDRIIEIVGEDASDKQQARGRWKHYAGSGCDMSSRDLQATTPR